MLGICIFLCLLKCYKYWSENVVISYLLKRLQGIKVVGGYKKTF